MHSYAFVCIHMHPSRIRMHPYASVCIHMPPLLIRMAIFDKKNPRKIQTHVDAVKLELRLLAKSRHTSNPVYKIACSSCFKNGRAGIPPETLFCPISCSTVTGFIVSARTPVRDLII